MQALDGKEVDEFSRLKEEWAQTVKDYKIEEEIRIRVHRSLSWATRMHEHQENDNPDESFLCGWISLNALFSTWDSNTRQCRPEKESLDNFIRMVRSLDRQQKLNKPISQLKGHIEYLLSSPYLNAHFWRELEDEVSSKEFSKKNQFEHFRKKGQSALILNVLLRIYVMRNQIMHGAATYGSEVNRHTLIVCREILEAFLQTFLKVIIGQAMFVKFGQLPYPPVD